MLGVADGVHIDVASRTLSDLEREFERIRPSAAEGQRANESLCVLRLM